jgi:hypothetical protein
MRLMIFCGLLIQMVLFSSEHKPSFRALVVYDSFTSDVQVAAAADAARVQEALGFAAREAGLQFCPKILTLNAFSQKAFHKWLKTINPKSRDVAFFYYAGRGSNHHHQKWPLIHVGAKKQISEKEVLKHINSRKPSLAAVVFDCYNKPVTTQGRVDFNQIRAVDVSQLESRPGLWNLFREHKGWIMCCSGKNAQRACYSSQQPPLGGLFTSNLLRGFFTYGKVRDIGWTHVTRYARSLSMDANVHSLPFFDAHFTKVPGVLIR